MELSSQPGVYKCVAKVTPEIESPLNEYCRNFASKAVMWDCTFRPKPEFGIKRSISIELNYQLHPRDEKSYRFKKSMICFIVKDLASAPDERLLYQCTVHSIASFDVNFSLQPKFVLDLVESSARN